MSEKTQPTNDGGMAFPDPARGGPASQFNQSPLAEEYGMKLRDYFASAAMQGFLANQYLMEQLNGDIQAAKLKDERLADSINRVVAKRAYMLADAMIATR